MDSSEKPFRIVAIYDSASSSSEAAHAAAIVLRELGDEVEVDKSSWNLESLGSLNTRALAASEAARADMIVIALTDSSPSAILKHWVQSWETKRQVPGGLLALIPAGEADTSHDLEHFLYDTAVTAQMDFICRKENRY